MAKSGREREAIPLLEELLKSSADAYIHSSYAAACPLLQMNRLAVKHGDKLLTDSGFSGCPSDQPRGQKIPAITLAELEHGVSKSAFPERNRIALVEFVTPFRILDFGQSAAHEYGRLRSRLEQAGQVIGPLDLLIAAHAVAENLTLVTNNERGFQRIPNLKIENWVR